ncbi:MAG TPA: ABC transporter ATP-binding protein, partial [Vicinamibacteria bacterium]|nr:ABC transporter ATP-binding protein [Vicinamibacteria bacterium]
MTVRLEARDLSVGRGSRQVLHGVSLALGAGESLALVGPNAAGKSTLVRTLAGLLPPSGGVVELNGRPLRAWARDALARHVALVTPEEEGPPALTVEDRVALGRYPHRGPFLPLTAGDRAAVTRALERTGIAPLARRRLGTLSAGERQLAALARGLAQEPEVLLLDEPSAHLDIGHQLALFRVLEEARARGLAVLAVVHDLQRAAAWAGRMALLCGGRIEAEGSPVEVLAGE